MPADVRLRLPGWDRFARRVDLAVDRLRGGPLAKVLLKAGLVVAGQAQRNVSGPRPSKLGVVTGRLRGSLHASITGPGQVTVGTNVEYARIHEFGGVIFARNPLPGTTTGRPWLRFRTRDGQWRTVDRVRIPARPYLGPALRDKREDVIRIVRQVYAGPLFLEGESV